MMRRSGTALMGAIRFILLGLSLLRFASFSTQTQEVSITNEKNDKENAVLRREGERKSLCFKSTMKTSNQVARNRLSLDMCANCPLRGICFK